MKHPYRQTTNSSNANIFYKAKMKYETALMEKKKKKEKSI